MIGKSLDGRTETNTQQQLTHIKKNSLNAI